MPSATERSLELFLVERMQVDDLDQIRRIEKESFPTPWPRDSYRREIMQNDRAQYLVLRRAGVPRAAPSRDVPPRRLRFPLWRFGAQRAAADDIVGFAGLWVMVDEAHITTIAVDMAHRGRGLGELMLIELIKLGQAAGASHMTLEVRVSNTVAQALYRKFSFRENGIRPRYYSDDREDALVMWSDPINDGRFKQRLAGCETALTERLRWESRL